MRQKHLIPGYDCPPLRKRAFLPTGFHQRKHFGDEEEILSVHSLQGQRDIDLFSQRRSEESLYPGDAEARA